MVNVGSSSSVGQSVFEFDTQAGITHLLGSIRASELSSDQKNELRDLVFLYSNGGKDSRVLLTLEQRISTYRLAAIPRKTPSASSSLNQPTIGKYRSAPSFAIKVSDHAEVAVPKTPDFTTDKTWKKDEVKTPPEIQVPQPMPMSAEVKEVPVAEPAPTQTPSSQVTETQPLAVNQDQSLERIRQIKALVNEKVGNPVNLVDINNEVGREYMAALLDAMKKLNSGSSASSAMARLEAALVSVEEALQNQGQKLKVAPVVSEVPAQTPIVSSPEPAPVIKELEAVEVQSEQFTPVAPLEKEGSADMPVIESSRVPIKDFGDRYNTPPPEPVAISTTPKREPHSTESVSGWDSTPKTELKKEAPVVASASGIKPLASLADLTQKTTLTSESTSKETVASTSDPLFSSEIDNGLEQLLEEWPIFKKSGLFGTGPKGREHPLFKKMAPLQIPLLLAGRFEGATQEIKQSITDYMNGWRYEQGLIYEQAETFEHYLRRVIRHILDLQKNKM